jgi:hypothetical protein
MYACMIVSVSSVCVYAVVEAYLHVRSDVCINVFMYVHMYRCVQVYKCTSVFT